MQMQDLNDKNKQTKKNTKIEKTQQQHKHKMTNTQMAKPKTSK